MRGGAWGVCWGAKCLATAARALEICASPEKVAPSGGGGGGVCTPFLDLTNFFL